MPLYEYFCDDCIGVFELLRPVRESSAEQPCPVCDEDGRRLMPTEFAAYIQREGLPRRIPDDGRYWTAKGLSKKADDGSGLVEGLGLTYPWQRKGTVTSEDDDREEARQRVMYETEMEAYESGRMPEMPGTLADQSDTYRQKKVNTAIQKKVRKTAANKDVTPRTRSGKHGTPKPAARTRAKKKTST